MSDSSRDRGLTLRSVLIGLCFAGLANFWVTWSDYIIHSSTWNLSHFPMVNFILFLLLTVFSAVSGRVFGPRFALAPSELATVMSMGLVGSVVPTNGFIGYVLGILATPYYLATPENGWGIYFHPYIPDWMAPSNSGDSMRYLFEGLPGGMRIPWQVWIGPLLWWLSFAGGIALVSACIVVCLRKQWTDYERLDYPIIGVGIDMAMRSRAVGWLPEYMHGRIFWGGFAVSCGIVCWNIPGYFMPGIPAFPLLPQWFTFATGFPTIDFHISFFAFAFAFFVNLEALFSAWFFFLLFILQSGVFNRFGYTIGTRGDPWSSLNPAVGWQSWGAMCFIVFWGLWVGRNHIKQVFYQAFRSAQAGRSEEMMSYRIAIFGLVFGLVYVIGFLHHAGMSYKMAIVLISCTLVGYLGVARIVAETGLLYVVVPVTGQSATIYLLGSYGMPPESMTAMVFTYMLVTRGAAMFMPSFTQMGKLADRIPQVRRGLMSALGGAIIAGVVISIVVTFYLGYSQGAYNFNIWVFGLGSQVPFIDTLTKIRTPFSTDWNRLFFFGIGVAVSALLTFLRYRFPGWPLSPIGFPLSTSWPMRRIGFTIFLAWLVKALVMKIGGVVLYRRFQPFALGLVVGWAVGVGISFAVDIIWFPGQGHMIHWY